MAQLTAKRLIGVGRRYCMVTPGYSGGIGSETETNYKSPWDFCQVAKTHGGDAEMGYESLTHIVLQIPFESRIDLTPIGKFG